MPETLASLNIAWTGSTSEEYMWFMASVPTSRTNRYGLTYARWSGGDECEGKDRTYPEGMLVLQCDFVHPRSYLPSLNETQIVEPSAEIQDW